MLQRKNEQNNKDEVLEDYVDTPLLPLIKEIMDLISKTSAYKVTLLNTLLVMLNEFHDSNEFDQNKFQAIEKYLEELLKDAKFIYKKVSIFGLLRSRSHDLAIQTTRFLENSIGLLLVSKLKKQNPQSDLSELEKSVNSKDYKTAYKILNDILLKDSKTKKMTDSYLNERIEAQLAEDFPKKKTYYPLSFPFLEVDAKQYTFDIYKLKSIMENKPKGTKFGFVFSIDEFGNLLFSEDTEKSKHINLCKPPVIGAGEVFLRNTNSGVELVVITNRSGLYLPEDEFANPLKAVFEKMGFKVQNTVFVDERQKQISDLTQQRLILK